MVYLRKESAVAINESGEEVVKEPAFVSFVMDNRDLLLGHLTAPMAPVEAVKAP